MLPRRAVLGGLAAAPFVRCAAAQPALIRGAAAQPALIQSAAGPPDLIRDAAGHPKLTQGTAAQPDPNHPAAVPPDPTPGAATPPNLIRIGVLGTETGGQAWSGVGALVAARLAAEDFSTQLDGRPVEVRSADFNARADDAVAIARAWFDDGVNAIVDMPISAAALAVQALARERQRTLMVTSATTAALTGRACAPTVTHWAEDSVTLANATVQGFAASGTRSWFLIVPDAAFTTPLERDTVRAIEAAGGRLLGIARHPPEAPEFATPLRQAIDSGAEAVALGTLGEKLARLVRQGRDIGLFTPPRRVVALQAYLADVQAAGLDVMQGLHLVEGFYWDQNQQTRAFARRFAAVLGFMPSRAHAQTYAAILHYLRATAAADSVDALVVNETMCRAPLYFFGRTGQVRLDGRVLFDLTLYQVKRPGVSRQPWDDLQPLATIAAADAFRPYSRNGCSRPG